MYLIDTDTVIYILKGHLVVQQNIKDHLQDPIMISVITCMELYYGAYKSQKVASNLAKIKTIEASLEIIPVGPEISETFGLLKAQMEKRGTRLDDFDLILAATALSHNLTLITNNTAHFKRIEGLKTENWTK